MKKVIAILFALFVLTACNNEAKFDSSTEETQEESTRAMIESLTTEKEQGLLFESIIGPFIKEAFKPKGKSKEEVLKSLNGLKAQELIDNAFTKEEQEAYEISDDTKQSINKILGKPQTDPISK
ncbi:membrane lipoprotein lipid attachment site-containing protein [Akkermansiaceae bacterium]|nr:membrane lipoprotein lipid attachment site-containing protein [Akkermansiaceae bacterium]